MAVPWTRSGWIPMKASDVRFVGGYWLPDAERWCDLWKVPTAGEDFVRLYKVTTQQLTTGTEYGHRVVWTPGATVSCGDSNWEPIPVCGGGLHLWPTLDAAVEWASKDLFRNEMHSRILHVEARISDLVPIAWPHLSRLDPAKLANWTFAPWAGKVKVLSCKVLNEVNQDEDWKLTHWYSAAAQERAYRVLK